MYGIKAPVAQGSGQPTYNRSIQVRFLAGAPFITYTHNLRTAQKGLEKTDEDEQEEGREMSESITEELREYAAEHSYWRRGTEYVTLNDLLPIADRIDARFDRELQAKQGEVDGLKADVADLQARLDASESYNSALRTECTDLRDKLNTRTIERDGLQSFLDASIPMPPDADGVPWTGREDEFIADTGERCRLLGVMHSVEGGDFLEVDDGSGRYFIADACHHVALEPPESIEDVRKSCDNTIAYLASVSGMGWHDVETFSKDVHKQLDYAYACGKRDGAGEQR